MNNVARFLTYSLGMVQMLTFLRAFSPDPTDVIVGNIDRRIAELKAEELRLAATRAYMLELWAEA